ncbi:MAG: response regulator, partial [Spirochaetaceae bacterium]
MIDNVCVKKLALSKARVFEALNVQNEYIQDAKVQTGIKHPQPKKILLVEDNPAVALDEAGQVRSGGFEVETTGKGAEAVKIVEKDGKVDLVLMDIDLGSGMDGYEAAQAILSHRDVPILFLSSYSDTETVERARGIPNYGYILKHTGRAILMESIHTALRLFDTHQEARLEREFYSQLYRKNPVMMLLLDKERNVRRYNSSAGTYMGRGIEKYPETRIGAALNCINHLNNPLGCGYGPECKTCELRGVILDTFSDGRSRTQVEVTLPIHPARLDTAQEEGGITFMVSASLIKAFGDVQVLVTLEDISERKRLENTLKKNQTLAEQAEKLTDIGSWEKDLVKGEFELSRGCQRVFGIHKRRASIEEMDRKVHPDDLQEVKSRFEEALRGEGYYECEHRIIREEDHIERVIYSQGMTVHDKTGTPVKMYGAVQDVTERRKIEQQNMRLIEEKEKLLQEVHHRIK